MMGYMHFGYLTQSDRPEISHIDSGYHGPRLGQCVTAKVFFPAKYMEKISKAFRSGKRFYFEGDFRNGNQCSFFGRFHAMCHSSANQKFEAEISVESGKIWIDCPTPG